MAAMLGMYLAVVLLVSVVRVHNTSLPVTSYVISGQFEPEVGHQGAEESYHVARERREAVTSGDGLQLQLRGECCLHVCVGSNVCSVYTEGLNL